MRILAIFASKCRITLLLNKENKEILWETLLKERIFIRKGGKKKTSKKEVKKGAKKESKRTLKKEVKGGIFMKFYYICNILLTLFTLRAYFLFFTARY